MSRMTRSVLVLGAVASLAAGGAGAAQARHGADDPVGHDRGDDHGVRHERGDDKGGARAARHGADDRRAERRHHHRRHREDRANGGAPRRRRPRRARPRRRSRRPGRPGCRRPRRARPRRRPRRALAPSRAAGPLRDTRRPGGRALPRGRLALPWRSERRSRCVSLASRTAATRGWVRASTARRLPRRMEVWGCYSPIKSFQSLAKSPPRPRTPPSSPPFSTRVQTLRDRRSERQAQTRPPPSTRQPLEAAQVVVELAGARRAASSRCRGRAGPRRPARDGP